MMRVAAPIRAGLVLVGMLAGCGSAAHAQAPAKQAPAAAPPAATAPQAAPPAKKPAPKLKPPEDVSLVTKDGMVLKATYYPGGNGKETVPVVMLHGFGGNRHEYQALATHLQSKGHAAIALDLRGHGDSTRFRGSDKSLDAKTMPQKQLLNFVPLDLEALRSDLLVRHNAGELNLDKLCLVGADMSAIVAAEWAVADWNTPPLATGKQGQDVKGIFMLSPTFIHKNLKMVDPMRSDVMRKIISLGFAVGKEDAKVFKDTERIVQQVERYRPTPIRPEDETLFVRAMDTTLQGTKLVKDNTFKLHDMIAAFVDARMAQQPYPWQARRNPLQ